jgi:hypothetical protein
MIEANPRDITPPINTPIICFLPNRPAADSIVQLACAYACVQAVHGKCEQGYRLLRKLCVLLADRMTLSRCEWRILERLAVLIVESFEQHGVALQPEEPGYLLALQNVLLHVEGDRDV